MRRLLSDIASNLFSLSTTFAERMVITGILIRHWGLGGFEFWSVAIAATGIFAIFDGGSAIVFSNRISGQLIRGERALAIRTFRQANFILTLLAAGGLVTLIALASSTRLQAVLGINPGPYRDQSAVILLALGCGVVLRLAMSNLVGVYRAHREFGRSMQLVTLGELVRVAAMALTVIAGGGLALTAIVYAVCSLGSMIQIWVFDVSRRWPDFRFRLERPRDAVLAGTLGQVWSFGLPFIPNLALLQGPILVLGGAASLGSGAIGSFVLLRTVANFVRMGVFKVVNVLAMKVTDVNDEEDVRITAALRPLRRLTALFLGLIGGGMLYYGRPLFALWSGKEGLFNPVTLFVMSAPMLLTPTYLFSLAILQYRGRPIVWTIGTFVQAAFAGVIFIAATGLAIPLRLALAVFGGELLAVALPVLWETHGRSVAAAVRIEWPYTLISLGAAAGSGALGWLLEFVLPSATLHGLLFHAAVQGTVTFIILGKLTHGEFRRWSLAAVG